MQRPKLGRPAADMSTHQEVRTPTEARNPDAVSEPEQNPTNWLSAVPQPPSPSGTDSHLLVNKLPVANGDATQDVATHETSIQSDRQPTSSGPPPVKPFSRPVRTTRNPNPVYVDAVTLPRPWSATKDEIAELNRLIS